MASNKRIVIDADVNTGDGVKNLGQLEDRFDKLNQQLRGADFGSEEFNRLQKEIAQTSSQIRDVELSMEGLDAEQRSTAVRDLSGSFVEMASGLALVGASGESMEEVIQSIARIEGITRGITAASEGWVAAQKLIRAGALNLSKTLQKLNAVMRANPAATVVVAVTALAAAYALFRSNSNEASRAQQAVNEAVKEGTKAAADAQSKIEILTAVVKSETASEEARAQAVKNINELSPEYLGNLTEEEIRLGKAEEALEEYIKDMQTRAELQVLEEQRKEVLGEILQAERDLEESSGLLADVTREAIKEKRRELNQIDEEILLRKEATLERDAETEAIRRQQAAEEEQAKENWQQFKDFIKTNKERKEAREKAAEEAAKEAEKRREEARRQAEEERKRQEEINANIEESHKQHILALQRQEKELREWRQEQDRLRLERERQQDIMLAELNNSALDNELNALADEFDAKFELAKGNAELTAQLEEQEAQRALEIQQRYAREEKEFKIRQDKEVRDAKIASAQSVFSVVEGINNLTQSLGVESVGLQRTVALAQIAFDTAKAISGAIASAQAIPFPGNIPAIATGVAAVLNGISQAIAAFDEAPSVSGAGGGGGGGTPTVPNVSEATLFGTVGTPTGESVSGNITGAGRRQTTIKAFVSETDITNTQNNIQEFEQLNELG